MTKLKLLEFKSTEFQIDFCLGYFQFQVFRCFKLRKFFWSRSKVVLIFSQTCSSNSAAKNVESRRSISRHILLIIRQEKKTTLNVLREKRKSLVIGFSGREPISFNPVFVLFFIVELGRNAGNSKAIEKGKKDFSFSAFN